MEKTKHFVALDGLRGAAALAVVVFHCTMSVGLPCVPFRGYLAVDFFFILSGFVVASAYEERLRHTMRFSRFLKIRMIRLYPMIALGTAIGAIRIFAHVHGSADAGVPPAPEVTLHNLIISFVLGMLILPFGPIGTGLMPLDPPLWSIMFEMFINIVYALAIKMLTNRVLLGVLAVSGGVLAGEAYRRGTIHVGFMDPTMYLGFARVTASFTLGVLLFRMFRAGRLWAIPQLPAPALVALLLVSFLPPYFSGGWAYDLAAVFVLFPFIVISASQGQPATKWVPGLEWAGRISYPLYVLHVPIVSQLTYHLSHGNKASDAVKIAAVAGVTLAAVVASQVAAVCYDEPVRRWLGSAQPRKQVFTVPAVDTNGPN